LSLKMCQSAYQNYLSGYPGKAIAELEKLDLSDARSETLALLFRAFIELDRAEDCIALSRKLNPSQINGEVIYWVGVAKYLCRFPLPEIQGAFQESLLKGGRLGYLGMAFLAYVDGDYADAENLAKVDLTKESFEYQHIQLMIQAQIAMASGRYDSAFEYLDQGYCLLRELNSVLRLAWNDVLYVRALRMSDQLKDAKSLLDRLTRWANPSLMPRLMRNIAQAVELVLSLDTAHHVDLPSAAELERTVSEAALYRKPMLACLYQYLKNKAGQGASKEELAQQVWTERYNPVIHDDRIYKAVARLRRIMGDNQSSPRILRQTGSAYMLCYRKT
jgi:hypothetical protein